MDTNNILLMEKEMLKSVENVRNMLEKNGRVHEFQEKSKSANEYGERRC